MRHALVALAALLALAPPAAAQVEEHTVYLHEYTGGLHIAPEIIYADVGDTLAITVVNSGASPHNFMVCGDGESPLEKCDERWAFTGMIPANESAQVTFEVPKAGTFDYYCYIAGHKGAGMAGKLVVQGEAEEKATIPAAPLGLLVLAALAVGLARRRRA